MTPRAMPPQSACAPQRDAVSHSPFSKTTLDTAYLRKIISLVSSPPPRQRQAGQVRGAWQLVLTQVEAGASALAAITVFLPRCWPPGSGG